MSSPKEILDAKLREIGGCGDSSCLVWVEPNSMVTNGGCRCAKDPIKMRRVLWAYSTYVANVEE
jgi:hypothetical protein